MASLKELVDSRGNTCDRVTRGRDQKRARSSGLDWRGTSAVNKIAEVLFKRLLLLPLVL